VIAAALALAIILLLIITQCNGDDGEQVGQIDTPSTPTVAPTMAGTPSVPSAHTGYFSLLSAGIQARFSGLGDD
jgi:hypothetical protein